VLSDEQFLQFARDGYIVLTDVVPEDLLAAADHEIDAVIAADPPPDDVVGHHFYFLSPDRLPVGYRSTRLRWTADC